MNAFERRAVAPPSVNCEPLSPARPVAAGRRWIVEVVLVLAGVVGFVLVMAHWFGTL